MKKTLIVSFVALFSVSLFGQNRPNLPVNWRNYTETESVQQTQLEYPSNQSNVPFVNKSVKALTDLEVGTTQYDLQTNANIDSRCHLFPDGTIGTTWIFGTSPTSYPERGTGYNYFNGSTWLANPTARIETQRTGWPSYAALGTSEDGEVVIAHNGSIYNLIMSKRAVKGTGAWAETILSKVAGTKPTWPVICTSGNKIHVLSSESDTGYVYNGVKNALYYSRSQDAGATWDILQVIPAGLETYLKGFGGDNYAWAKPQGNTIAFVIGNMPTDVVLMKSTDAGTTWTKTVVFQNPHPNFQVSVDTFYTTDGHYAVELGPNGNAHVVFGIKRIQNTTSTSYTKWSLFNGIGIWNEGDPTFTGINALNPDILDTQGKLVAEVQDHNGDGTVFENYIGGTTIFANYKYGGPCSQPQLSIDANGDMYVVYTSAVEDMLSGSNIYYNHLWGRKFCASNSAWGSYLELTAGTPGDYDQVEQVYPSLSKTMNNQLHIVYMYDITPGAYVEPSNPSNPVIAGSSNYMMYLTVDKTDFSCSTGSLPAIAGTISGTATVCQGQPPVTYTVPAITNATSYVWTLPTGATGTSTTNSITVNYGVSAISGYVTVKGHNSYGDGAISSLAITVSSLPASAGTISGTATVCQGQNSVTYTVPAITNATSYVWTLPTGATGTSITNSITVNYGASAVSGNITVKGNNSCGNGAISTKAITVTPLTASAGTISGTASVCQGQNSVTYTVPAITNATSYVWTLPTGATGTSATNSITINYGTSAVSGNITVKGTNSCGDGATSSLAITVNPPPSSAGTISGTINICQGQSITYTVPAITNATSYIWTLPTGATGTSTTNSITVSYGTSAVSGNITVKGHNSCGDGTISTIAITVNPLPLSAGTISGTTAVCQGQNSVTYTVPVITNATSYVWTLPIGATGTSTTNSITVNYGASAVSGNITVKGNNSCGDGATSTIAITVNQLTANAGTISGTTSVCQGQNAVIYTVPAIANATSYVWTLPTGATGTSTTNSITVNFGTSAVSGGIEVYGQNICGVGSSSIIAISVNSLPANAGTISGNTTVCQGQNSITYTVPAITNATSYIWTLPSGATGTSTTNSIIVNYGTSAISGNITVKGNNSSCDGLASTLAITVSSLPSNAGTISGNTTVCQGQNIVTYAVPTIANATTYVWTLPNGATGTSTTNSINVNYGTSAISGNITVKGNNSCGDGSSSTIAITVNPLPSNAGTISGATAVCQGQNAITYTVPAIADAASYIWTLPTGATGTSTTNSITVNYSTSAISGNITVKGNNSCGDGAVYSLAIVANVNPTVPTVGPITQPTCTVATGSVFLYGLPVGNWTINPGSIAGSTTSTTISGLTDGTYTYTITNASGCASVASANVVINSQPTTPTTPTVGPITQPTCIIATGSVFLYDLPATGTWTLTITPGGTTTTGTGTSTTISGLATGTYTYTVINASGCTSVASANVVINAQPQPATPIITLNGNILQSDATTGNQWYNQNGLIIGATSQNYTPLIDGDYYVVVTDNGCSSDPSNTINVIVSGIVLTENNKTINVYPNPVTNELNIEFVGNKNKLNFEILNSIGQVVFKGIMLEKTIVQTSNFDQGIYMLKLENGKTFEFKKIIKE